MTIYIDIIFLENFILNFILLYAVGIETKSKIKHYRIIIASLVGSIYAIILYVIKNKFLCSIVMKFLLSIVMVYICFETKSIKKLFKTLIYFYLTSFVFGGGALALIYMVNTGKISIQNGIIQGRYTILTIMTGVIIAFIFIIIVFRLIKSKISKNDLICNIEIRINNKEVKTKAMIDTGNLLKEPITNIPVIIVEHSLLKNIIPNEILQNIDNILGGDLSEISESIKNQYLLKMKVIPFTSLGKQNGMLLGIKAQELKIEEINETKKIEKIIIGLYNKTFSKKGEYHALIGLLS
ncbi:MAG: sigma-E processing peptidase SpoIIGA [Clostridia bacterium]|nr:sigma-E processing peptidase SpoIIGA [Clostridia bacterium]